MSGPFSYKQDYFFPALIIALSAHVVVLGVSGMLSSPYEFAVEEGPSSLEIQFVREVPQIVAPPVPLIEQEPDKVIVTEEVVPDVVQAVQDIAPEAEIPEPAYEEIPVAIPESIVEEIPHDVIQDVVQRIADHFPEDFIAVDSPAAQGVIREAQPLALKNPPIIYPRVAKRRGWEGTVELRIFVERNGKAREVLVEKSSGYSMLDDSAKKTVKKWEFQAAQSGELVLSSWITVPVRFELNEY